MLTAGAFRKEVFQFFGGLGMISAVGYFFYYEMWKLWPQVKEALLMFLCPPERRMHIHNMANMSLTEVANIIPAVLQPEPPAGAARQEVAPPPPSNRPAATV